MRLINTIEVNTIINQLAKHVPFLRLHFFLLIRSIYGSLSGSKSQTKSKVAVLTWLNEIKIIVQIVDNDNRNNSVNFAKDSQYCFWSIRMIKFDPLFKINSNNSNKQVPNRHQNGNF